MLATTFGSGPDARWSADAVGLPFPARWSLFSGLCEADARLRDSVLRAARGTVPRLPGEAPPKALVLPADAPVAPASAPCPLFADCADVAGVARLIATGWADDEENLDVVCGTDFRSLVLDVKRGARGLPSKLTKGRGLLPTHEYVQTILLALDGKKPMFGAAALPGGGWADDYDAARNPAGCPAWVLATVVTAAAVDGLRLVLDNIGVVRRALEARTEPVQDRTRTFAFGDARVALPLAFLRAAHAVVHDEAPISALRETKKQPQPQPHEDVFWRQTPDAERDALLMECLLRNARGLATLANYVRGSAAMPAWLRSYVADAAAPFGPDPDVQGAWARAHAGRKASDYARAAAEQAPPAKRARKDADPPAAAADPNEFLRRFVEARGPFARRFAESVLTPPGMPFACVRLLLSEPTVLGRLDVRAQCWLRTLGEVPEDVATRCLRGAATGEDTALPDDPALAVSATASFRREWLQELS